MNKELFSTNHKYIGTIYFILGILAGILGIILRITIQIELAQLGPFKIIQL